MFFFGIYAPISESDTPSPNNNNNNNRDHFYYYYHYAHKKKLGMISHLSVEMEPVLGDQCYDDYQFTTDAYIDAYRLKVKAELENLININPLTSSEAEIEDMHRVERYAVNLFFRKCMRIDARTSHFYMNIPLGILREASSINIEKQNRSTKKSQQIYGRIIIKLLKEKTKDGIILYDRPIATSHDCICVRVLLAQSELLYDHRAWNSKQILEMLHKYREIQSGESDAHDYSWREFFERHEIPSCASGFVYKSDFVSVFIPQGKTKPELTNVTEYRFSPFESDPDIEIISYVINTTDIINKHQQ